MFHPHDGRPVKVPPYRRMMGFLMKGRNESAVYFEQHVDLTRTLPWIDEWNHAGGGAGRANVFHLILHSLGQVIHDRERLNRFTVGRRIFQRNGVFLSFAAKKKMSDDAPLAMVKRQVERGEAFGDLVARLTGDVGDARSAAPSAIDKELSVLLRLPSFLLSLLIGVLGKLYAVGLAPRALIDTDPMYASAFVANLGSIKIDAAYHHLFEHGNCPLFMTIGQITEVPAVVNGQIVARPTLTLRFSFDERVEDGLYCARSLSLLRERIENPSSWIGALAKAA